MFLKRFLVISLWIVSHASCGELTFLDAVDRFLSHNNDLKIAHYEIDKSKADLLGAQRRPNPILYGSYSFLDAKHHFKDQSIASQSVHSATRESALIYLSPSLSESMAGTVGTSGAERGWQDQIHRIGSCCGLPALCAYEPPERSRSKEARHPDAAYDAANSN